MLHASQLLLHTYIAIIADIITLLARRYYYVIIVTLLRYAATILCHCFSLRYYASATYAITPQIRHIDYTLRHISITPLSLRHYIA